MRAGPLLLSTLVTSVTASSLGAAATPAVAADEPATAAAAAGPTAAGPAAAARARRATPPVVAPRPGAVVRTHRVRIRVRSGDAPGALRARLNGVAVSADFGPSRGGVRALVTTVSHGLRRGRNTLRVTVVRSGQPPRRATVRFTVRTRRALTGAGRDRRVAIRATASMVGRTLAPRRGARSAARWRVVAGPGVRRTPVGRARTRARGAQRALGNGLPPAALTPPLLASPAGLAASFRPVVPGRYTLRLTSGSGAARSSDEVTLTAVPRSPLVQLDTMTARDGDGRGIRVGETTYLLRDAQGRPQGTDVVALQVVVLDRDTLGPISNKAYDSSQRAIPELKALHDDEQLVIVSLQAGDASTSGDFESIDQGLAGLGFPAGRLPLRPGSFSGVGVPGMKPGEADVSVVPFSTDTGRIATYGRMQGYLSPDQWDNYGFIPGERVPFRYVAPESPCGPGASCAGSVGFRLLVQDWKTLDPARNSGVVYQTGRPDLTSARQTAEMQKLIDALAAVDDGDLVTLQAVSTRSGDGYLPPVGQIEHAAMFSFSRAIARFGGTRHALNSIARATGPAAGGGSTYTLVGWKDAGEGAGAEVAANVQGAGPAPALSGVLRPDRESRLRPAEVSSASQPSADPTALGSLMLREPGEWPLSDPRHAAAIAYIGGTQPRLGSDPRAAYWLQGFSADAAGALADAVERTSYPAGREGDFSADEFVEAREQLAQELRWVGNVRSYFSDLKEPFSDGGLQQWVTAQTVADEVLDDVDHPDDELALEWIEFTAQVLELLGPATEEVSGVLGGLLELGMWTYGATKAGGPDEGEMRIHADSLGRALVDRAEQAKATLDQVADAIVGDYAKLAIVGRYGGCTAGPGGCPAAYAYLALDRRDKVRNRLQIRRGVERLAYQKLVPLGYPVMALSRIGNGERMNRTAPPNVDYYFCNADYPWRGYPANASASLLYLVDPQGISNDYDTFVLARAPGVATTHGTPPSDELLRKMFGPLRTDESGGVALDPGAFMAAARHRTWYADEETERKNCFWQR